MSVEGAAINILGNLVQIVSDYIYQTSGRIPACPQANCGGHFTYSIADEKVLLLIDGKSTKYLS